MVEKLTTNQNPVEKLLLSGYSQDCFSMSYFIHLCLRLHFMQLEQLKDQNLIHLFKDSNFTFPDYAGHPEDDPDELFASGYTVWKHYQDAFRQQDRYRTATEEQKKMAEQVFQYIQQTLEKIRSF